MSSCTRLLPIFLAASLCGFQVGCTSFGDLMANNDSEIDTSLLAQQGYAIPPGGMPIQVDPTQMAGAPSIVMEVRNGPRHLERIPLPSDRPVFIEDIVQQAQLAKRLGRLKISIMRSGGPGAPPVNMDVEIDGDGKASSVGCNYALRPEIMSSSI